MRENLKMRENVEMGENVKIWKCGNNENVKMRAKTI